MNWRGSAARFGPSAGLARPSAGLARLTAVQGHQQSVLKVSLPRSLEPLILIDAVSPGKQTRNCSGTQQNSGWRCVPAK